jgi:hypothetical protein
MSIDTSGLLIPENGQNRAQNVSGIDSSDIFPKTILDGKPNVQGSIEEPTDKIPNSIYRLGHSDTFACHNCKQRGDKWYMRQHLCKGVQKSR